MALRWYTIVVDCNEPATLAAWWAEVLGYTKIYEADDEVVIIPKRLADAPFGSLPFHESPPGIVFGRSPDRKTVKNRIHIDLAPHTSDDREAEIARVLAMGATRADVGQTGDEGWDVFADPEGNEFCILSSRDY